MCGTCVPGDREKGQESPGRAEFVRTAEFDLVISPLFISDEVEVVERKGAGHPDTICDALEETFSLQAVSGIPESGLAVCSTTIRHCYAEAPRRWRWATAR